jgi:ABC-2 type transport system ATP-binding protein
MEFFETKGIHKVYGSTHALSDVSISVPKASIFGLLGPNGAGKTTLIRIINQITAPDQGEVFLEGRRMTGNDVSIIGYLPEERGLYTKMKIGEQALYLAQLKGMTRNQAMQSLKYWFKKFDITTWWEKKVEELSKGMQQKVQFITTVVHNPQLLIFDEPFSGFDPINANLIKQEILELRDKGATILFSTHNMGTVEDLCDHIALINKSRKILDGPVQEVKETFKSNIFELSYKGDFDQIQQALDRGFSILEHKESPRENFIRIQYTDGNGNNELIRMLLGAADIRSFREVIPSMNDVFIKAVEHYNAQNAVNNNNKD